MNNHDDLNMFFWLVDSFHTLFVKFLLISLQGMIQLYQLGFLGADAMSLLVKRYIEEYGYGSTEQFMEAIEKGVTQGQMSQQQMKQMKIALLQVLDETKAVGPAHDSN